MNDEIFEIYSTPACGNCVQAKNLLNSKGFEYKEYIVGQTVQKSDIEERCNCNVRQVPQIFKGNQYIGSLNELKGFLQ